MWLKTPIQDAFKSTVNDYQMNLDKYPGKQIMFTEYGWTTKADSKMNQDEANEINQHRYLSEIEAWSTKNKITMFTFEAFDEPWKGSANPDEPEKHWGIMDVKRKPKLYFSQK
jgi:exo-beta-1,3-glucanase (GH17 family)